MKRILLLLFFTNLIILSCLSCQTSSLTFTSNHNYSIKKGDDYNSKEIYDDNGKLVYVLNRSDARIDWKTEIIQSYLLYLTSNDELVVVDLMTSEKKMIIADVGDFAATNDLHYICLGKKLNHTDLSMQLPKGKLSRRIPRS